MASASKCRHGYLNRVENSLSAKSAKRCLPIPKLTRRGMNTVLTAAFGGIFSGIFNPLTHAVIARLARPVTSPGPPPLKLSVVDSVRTSETASLVVS